MAAKAGSQRTGRWRALCPGDAVTAWAAGAPSATHFPGTARPMPDRVDYLFRNGWTETGDLPCREALKALVADRKVERPQGPFPHLAVADEGPELDFSAFCHRPQLITRAFQCVVRSRTGGPLRLRLATCGGVRLWLDEAPAATFEPFLRNQRREASVTLDLPAGEAVLTLRLEDLHERDTTNFFSVILEDGPALDVALPPHLAPDLAEAAAQALQGLHFDHVFHASGPVSLRADAPLPAGLRLDLEGPAQFQRGGITAEPGNPRQRTLRFDPASRAAVAFDTREATAGCQHMTLRASLGAVQLSRSLGTSVVKTGEALTGPLVTRKARAAEAIAAHASFDPSVAALLALRGKNPGRRDAILHATLTTIEERHDCSDFSILPLLRMWREAYQNLPADLQTRMQAAILGYRYWLTEPGNDVMWFWSENHVLCFHTAQIVAGTLFPDAVFANSGRTGRALADEAGARLTRWFDSIDAHGLCEWNSAAYYPIDLLGLFTLHDMVPAFKARAAGVLDRIFAMTALHTSGDTPAGSQGRCYEKELLAGPATELGSLAAIAFGRPYLPGYDRAATLFCLSDYTPPPGLAVLHRPPAGQSLTARYTQGQDHAGRLSLWKSPDIQLSTAAGDAAGQRGHQAHVIDVQAAAHPMARLWINHPGELKEWGDRRPSLLAGNHVMPHVAQDGDTALLIYDLARPWTQIGFTQLFAARSAFETPQIVDDWWLFSCGTGQVAVWCSTDLSSATGTYAGSLWRAEAPRVGWVVTVARPGETAQAFCARLAAAGPAFAPEDLRLTVTSGEGRRLSLAFGADPTADGHPLPFAPLSPAVHVGWNGADPTPWRPDDSPT